MLISNSPRCVRAPALSLCAVLLVCWLGAAEARAQLAITEAMSWASTNCAGCEDSGTTGCRPDFWEVTNFGDTEIDLQGYLYIDKDGAFPDAGWRIDRQVIIQPYESVIFFRSGLYLVTNEATFRNWWGTNLAADVKIVCCYPMQGLDDLGDAVRLFDPADNLVDQVFFGETRRGFTFAYDTATGAAAQSRLGECGAFQAAACDDIGSPGTHCGPVALLITQQPASQTVDAGNDVTLQVQAQGLPRPRYRWYFNGTSIDNPIATNKPFPRLAGFAGCGPAWIETPVPPNLTISNVQPSNAGDYYVEVFNGLEKATSIVVRLTVTTSPSPVRLECPTVTACVSVKPNSTAPALVVAPGQPATFTVVARGYPPPRFQWSWSDDGVCFEAREGETNRSLVIESVQASEAGVYRVRAWNSEGESTADATLVVESKAMLKVTEVMASPCNPAAKDWWEITNLDDRPVNLCGYRWDDGPGNIGGGPTVDHPVIIQPGESVVFLEGMTTNSFIEWWGATNLPAGLQFIRYTANGFESDGDEIVIWNPTSARDADSIDSVGFQPSFGTSMWFAPNDPCTEFGLDSVAGECGAFRSALGCDAGSPGWTAWTPPQFTSIRRVGTNVILEWKAQPGSVNQLQYATSLASPASATVWNNLGSPFPLAGATDTYTDGLSATTTRRFYRVQRVSPANCPCELPEF